MSEPTGLESTPQEFDFMTLLTGGATMTPSVDLITELIREAFPVDFGDLPLYIVLSSRLNGALGSMAIVHGCVNRDLDLTVRDHVPTWRGRGPAVLVNDIGIIEFYGPVAAPTVIASVVVHEGAHVIELDYLADYRTSQPAPDPVQLVMREVELERFMEERPTGRQLALDMLIDFDLHGIRFLRIMLHLHHRVSRRGVYLPLNRPFQHPHHSNIGWYAALLTDEMCAMETASAAEILGTPAPEKFVELWESDRTTFEAFLASHFAKPKPIQKGETTMRTLDKILDALAKRLVHRRTETVKGFTALAAALADGKAPDVEKVERILIDANKSAEDLKVEVDRVLHRRGLAKIAGERPALEAEQAVLNEQARVLIAEREAAEKAYQEGMHAVGARQAGVTEGLRVINAAVSELVTDPDDDGSQLSTFLAPLVEKQQTLRSRNDELKRELLRVEAAMDEKRKQTIAEEMEGPRGRYLSPDNPQVKRAIAAALAPEMAALDKNGAERLAVQAELRELDKQIEAARRAFVPLVA